MSADPPQPVRRPLHRRPGTEPGRRTCMLITETRIRTDHPNLYLAQFCRHPGRAGGRLLHLLHVLHGGGTAPRIHRVERSGARRTVDVGSGRCTLHAGPGVLNLRVEAGDRDSLERVQHWAAERLRRISKGGALHVTWHPEGTADHSGADHTPMETAVVRSRHGLTIGAVAVVTLVVAVHVGFGVAVLEAGPWKHWVIGSVLAAVLFRGAYVLRRSAGRRRTARDTR
ncbi:DUF2218 domain-containing protein [Streptomyces sp. NPDC002574]|uniref:DUF2218 domain-containing protein n=1 Tax=Streptomyces sp. NPDC002574 TaxID=3364652 RepID=UPI0036B543C1